MNTWYIVYAMIGLIIALLGYLVYWFFTVERIANFLDEKGRPVGSKRFKRDETSFVFGKGRYNVDEKNALCLEERKLGRLKYKKYFYDIKHSNPLTYSHTPKPQISPELYNINMESKVARDLNEMSKEGLAKYLTPTNIVIAIVIVIIAVYLLQGGKIA